MEAEDREILEMAYKSIDRESDLYDETDDKEDQETNTGIDKMNEVDAKKQMVMYDIDELTNVNDGLLDKISFGNDPFADNFFDEF